MNSRLLTRVLARLMCFGAVLLGVRENPPSFCQARPTILPGARWLECEAGFAIFPYFDILGQAP